MHARVLIDKVSLSVSSVQMVSIYREIRGLWQYLLTFYNTYLFVDILLDIYLFKYLLIFSLYTNITTFLYIIFFFKTGKWG